ncbi:MAG: hypothetical protein F6K47_22000 [Symploca sp. SIO2E6]|nr:hypothetical protein [Symploca sp. SIO2E6]
MLGVRWSSRIMNSLLITHYSLLIQQTLDKVNGVTWTGKKYLVAGL